MTDGPRTHTVNQGPTSLLTQKDFEIFLAQVHLHHFLLKAFKPPNLSAWLGCLSELALIGVPSTAALYSFHWRPLLQFSAHTDLGITDSCRQRLHVTSHLSPSGEISVPGAQDLVHSLPLQKVEASCDGQILQHWSVSELGCTLMLFLSISASGKHLR